jgi:hypothetical protein
MATVDSVQTLFKDLHIKYLASNDWTGLDKQAKKSRECKLVGRTEGVQIVKCPEGHLCAGRYGLFATQPFEKFDIVGEYTGVITRDNGEYVASLRGEGSNHDCLGVNGEFAGE